MRTEDLLHIFKAQIDQGSAELMFMVTYRTEYPQIRIQVGSHPASELDSLALFLNGFECVDENPRLPKFRQQ
jgi:hypothetical protein